MKSENNVSDLMTKNCTEQIFQCLCQDLLNGTLISWREDVSEDVVDDEQLQTQHETVKRSTMQQGIIL